MPEITPLNTSTPTPNNAADASASAQPAPTPAPAPAGLSSITSCLQSASLQTSASDVFATVVAFFSNALEKVSEAFQWMRDSLTTLADWVISLCNREPSFEQQLAALKADLNAAITPYGKVDILLDMADLCFDENDEERPDAEVNQVREALTVAWTNLDDPLKSLIVEIHMEKNQNFLTQDDARAAIEADLATAFSNTLEYVLLKFVDFHLTQAASFKEKGDVFRMILALIEACEVKDAAELNRPYLVCDGVSHNDAESAFAAEMYPFLAEQDRLIAVLRVFDNDVTYRSSRDVLKNALMHLCAVMPERWFSTLDHEGLNATACHRMFQDGAVNFFEGVTMDRGTANAKMVNLWDGFVTHHVDEVSGIVDAAYLAYSNFRDGAGDAPEAIDEADRANWFKNTIMANAFSIESVFSNHSYLDVLQAAFSRQQTPIDGDVEEAKDE